MIDIRTKTVDGESVTVPPPVRYIREEADKTVGVRMWITPEIASNWIDTKGGNRIVSQSIVDRYVADMLGKRWKFNGAPIQFDEEGKLLNGQHRLWAIIESGCPQEFVVQWGIPRDSQDTIDAGATWKGKDVLHMKRETNCVLLNAAVRWIVKEEKGSLMAAVGMSNALCTETLERHPKIRESVNYVVAKSKCLNGSIGAYLHYKLAPLNKDKADEFIARVDDGQLLSTRSPLYRLRERLVRNQRSKGKLPPVDIMALAIIAWNAFYRGDEMTALTWRKAGDAAQPFPIIEALYGSAHVKRQKAKPRRQLPLVAKA